MTNPYGDRVDNINAQSVDGASLSVDPTLGSIAASDEFVPSQKAVYDFVMNVVTGNVPIDHNGLENKGFDASGHTGFGKAAHFSDVDPTQYNDSSQLYMLGQFWFNTTLMKIFIATDVTVNNAVWTRLYTSAEVDAIMANYSNTTETIAYAIALG